MLIFSQLPIRVLYLVVQDIKAGLLTEEEASSLCQDTPNVQTIWQKLSLGHIKDQQTIKNLCLTKKVQYYFYNHTTDFPTLSQLPLYLIYKIVTDPEMNEEQVALLLGVNYEELDETLTQKYGAGLTKDFLQNFDPSRANQLLALENILTEAQQTRNYLLPWESEEAILPNYLSTFASAPPLLSSYNEEKKRPYEELSQPTNLERPHPKRRRSMPHPERQKYNLIHLRLNPNQPTSPLPLASNIAATELLERMLEILESASDIEKTYPPIAKKSKASNSYNGMLLKSPTYSEKVFNREKTVYECYAQRINKLHTLFNQFKQNHSSFDFSKLDPLFNELSQTINADLQFNESAWQTYYGNATSTQNLTEEEQIKIRGVRNEHYHNARKKEYTEGLQFGAIQLQSRTDAIQTIQKQLKVELDALLRQSKEKPPLLYPTINHQLPKLIQDTEQTDISDSVEEAKVAKLNKTPFSVIHAAFLKKKRQNLTQTQFAEILGIKKYCYILSYLGSIVFPDWHFELTALYLENTSKETVSALFEKNNLSYAACYSKQSIQEIPFARTHWIIKDSQNDYEASQRLGLISLEDLHIFLCGIVLNPQTNDFVTTQHIRADETDAIVAFYAMHGRKSISIRTMRFSEIHNRISKSNSDTHAANLLGLRSIALLTQTLSEIHPSFTIALLRTQPREFFEDFVNYESFPLEPPQSKDSSNSTRSPLTPFYTHRRSKRTKNNFSPSSDTSGNSIHREGLKI